MTTRVGLKISKPKKAVKAKTEGVKADDKEQATVTAPEAPKEPTTDEKVIVVPVDDKKAVKA